jgi:putative hydrolase of the HAD superfamily
VSIEPDREVLDLARGLKGEVVLSLLTNNGPLLKESFHRAFPEAAEIFGRHAHFSCEFAACKPDPLVFQRLVEHLGVDPSTTLFIDDNASYIDGAIEAGLQAHHFQSAASLRSELAGLSG